MTTQSVIAVSSGGSYRDLPMPAYQGYKTTPNEIVKSSRNTLGNLYKYRINVKATLEVEWHGLTPEQKNLVCSMTEPNEFNVKYFDTYTSTWKYAKMYRGNDPEVTPYLKWDGSDFGRYDVKLSLIEF